MTNSKILATSKTCGPCHAIKAKIKKLGIDIEIKEYSPETKLWFDQHGIKSVPRLVIETSNGFEVIQGENEILEELKNDK